MRLPFRFLEPTFFAGLFDDPLLYLKVRPFGRALLFDCGQLHHLAKRVIRSLDAVFITHAHMDHFMGIEHLTRSIHVAPRTLEIFGPPGIAGKLQHKLQAYDWNLAEPFWGSYRVHEYSGKSLRTYLFAGPEGFACREEEAGAVEDGVIYCNRWLRVRSVLCEHKIPVLAFRIEETESFRLDDARIAAENLVKGEWLRELNLRQTTGKLGRKPLRILRRQDNAVVEEQVEDLALYRRLRSSAAPASIGYLTDVGYTEENLARVRQLFTGLTLLVCECTFLAEDVARARRSFHLCTSDLNDILQFLRPQYFLPMHHSKNYLRQPEAVYRELAPPPGTTLLRLPGHVTPRPLLASEIAWQGWTAPGP